MREIRDLKENEAIRVSTFKECQRILALCGHEDKLSYWKEHRKDSVYMPVKGIMSHKDYVYDHNIVYDSKLF